MPRDLLGRKFLLLYSRCLKGEGEMVFGAEGDVNFGGV